MVVLQGVRYSEMFVLVDSVIVRSYLPRAVHAQWGVKWLLLDWII